YLPNRKTIEMFLKKTPVILETAENGRTAVEKVQADDYDLVLMDLEMPVMDGLAATRNIRKWEQENDRPPIPIIALTAHAFSEHRAQCLEAGCSDFMPKPVKKKHLLETIWKYSAAFPPASREAEAPVKEPAPAAGTPPPPELEKTHTVVVHDDLAGIIGDYLRSLKDDLRTMAKAYKDKDFDTLFSLAHDLKGSGGSYGLDRVTEIGAAICRLAQAKDLPAIARQVKDLADYLKKIKVFSKSQAEAAGVAAEKKMSGPAPKTPASLEFRVKVDPDLAEVMEDYLEALTQDFRKLVQAFKARDFETVYRLAQDLKGSGGAYGLDRVTELGRDICDSIRGKNFGP
ncbi:MAG: response regulator, partial [Thermodesulfobacteriota bacterium]